MSGRSGYRKTDRRQGPPKPLIERLHAFNRKYGRDRKQPIRLFFRLPVAIEKLVHLGQHQNLLFNIEVFKDGVQGYANEIGDGLEGLAIFVRIYTGTFKGETIVPVSIVGQDTTLEAALIIKNNIVGVGGVYGEERGSAAQSDDRI